MSEYVSSARFDRRTAHADHQHTAVFTHGFIININAHNRIGTQRRGLLAQLFKGNFARFAQLFFVCPRATANDIADPGEEIAKKTFNSRLGIEGGISILGTSGIVEPMSEKALLDTIFLELNTRKSAGDSIAVLVPGNYGEDFAKKTFGIKNTVQCSNYIGDAIDYASDLGFSDILIISHMGKLVKLGSGIMNTHSKYADGRMETLALCAALAGVENFADILDYVTTDEAYEIIGDTKTIDILMKRIDKYLKHRSDVNIGAIMFLNKQGIIGKTADVDGILERI